MFLYNTLFNYIFSKTYNELIFHLWGWMLIKIGADYKNNKYLKIISLYGRSGGVSQGKIFEWISVPFRFPQLSELPQMNGFFLIDTHTLEVQLVMVEIILFW